MKKAIFLLALSFAASAGAEVRLPGWMTSNMVLQQQTTVHLSATAKKGATVKITASWDGQTRKAQADRQTGAFSFDLSVPKAGGPYTLTFDDGQKTVLENVMAGEVWFCSGQSNMEMPVKGWGRVKDFEKEVAAANHPLVRLFQVEHVVAHQPQTHVPLGHTQGWAVCSPQMVGEFSAAAYFFAREVSQRLGVAVGVVNSSWGGTPAETWISHEELKHVQGFEQQLARIEETGFDEAKINALYETEREAWNRQFFAADQGLANGDINNPRWTAIDASDGQWKTINLPGEWETSALPGFDGVVWFRKSVEVPAQLAGKDLTLKLGQIDDEDITYFNGEKIAQGAGWTTPRTYTVPGRLVKEGRNVITVRVLDTGGEGGFRGTDKDMSLSQGQTVLPLAGEWRFAIGLDGSQVGPAPKAPDDSWYPSNLFNAMVAPFLSMPIRGFLWYQGCANVGRAVQYESLFQTLIHDWQARFNRNADVATFPKPAPSQNERRRFRQQQDSKVLPFYFVQIANYLQRHDLQPQSEWAAIREAQRKALQLDGVGMAVNIDIGEANDIHPKNKQEVGHRLALLALNRTYGRDEACAAPEFFGMRISEGKCILTFRPTQGSGMLAENADVKGFSIAGPDHRWHVAKAHTEGQGGMQRVVVASPDVPHPVAVRYAWADNPECNLQSTNGLPVGPFRTDDWPDFK